MMRVAIVIIALLTGLLARAYEMTLEQCVDSALLHSPRLQAASLEVDRARIMRSTAFDPPNTEVTLKQETTGGGGPENGVYFGQEFDFPTKYVARHKSLAAQGDLAATRHSQQAVEVRREVSELYYSMLYSRELLRLNAELGAVYSDFCNVAEIRLREGDAGQLELMNARRVSEKNMLDGQQELTAYRNLQLEMERLTGIADVDPAGAFETPHAVSLREDGAAGVDSLDFASSAAGRVAAAEVAVADREYFLARHDVLPSIRLGATVQALIKSFNPYHIERLPFEKGNFMGFEVGITVPLFFGATSARIKAADVDRRISLLNMQTAETLALSESERLRSELASVSNRIIYYKESALPQAAEIERIAKVSYELGDISYVEYISNMETVYEIYREYAAAVNTYNQTLLRLEAIFW